MNSKKLITGLGIAGGALGVIGGVLNITQTVDQMKNGVKLRDDQLQTISNAVSVNVYNALNASSQVYIDAVVQGILKSKP